LAGSTDTPFFAGKLEQKLVSAITAADPGEAVFEVTTSQITSNYLAYDRSEKSRNDSHHNEGTHMFAFLFGISPEKQIKNGKISIYRKTIHDE